MAQRKHGSTKNTDILIINPASLTADVSGVLPTANGGTGTGAPTLGQILKGVAGNLWGVLSLGSAGNGLRVNPAGTDIEWWPSRSVVRLTADNAAIAAAAPTTVVAVANLVQAVGINEEWDVEWLIFLIPSVATDVYVVEVLPTAGTFTGQVVVVGENGVPNTGAGITKFFTVATGVITVASANAPGNSGSTTLPTVMRVRTVGKQTVSAGNLQLLIRAGTSGALTSGTVVVKLQSQMVASRIA